MITIMTKNYTVQI